MDGIMILNTIATPVYSFGWNLWCWLLLIPFLLGAYLVHFTLKNQRRNISKIWGWVGSLLIILSMSTCYGVCSTQNKTYEYSYQVLIDNSVDMENFRTNYEIVNQIGITYVIRQK